MLLLGKTIIKQLQQSLQWVLKGIWHLIIILFWLLIQQIELFAWFVAEISTQIKKLHHHLKPGLTQNFQILLAPLTWLLQNIWGLLVAIVWLLFQLIELTAWYLSRLRRLPWGKNCKN
ncbi:hypothetical protein [[Phormidium] sp. ETS-05]|uniref:hypothetical protein n=1 Tax=[Phormidium] sp. ETS-05 TaxID=222819 RepID=UPI0018EF29C6|nr:hypothetical protein [[Phormidium] sp. ETS-05]